MRDVRVQVLLTAEEYIALSHMADEDGDSHSGMLRRLFRKECRRRAADLSLAEQGSDETRTPAHDLHNN